MPDANDDLWPPGVTPDDAAALDELAATGVGEGDFSDDHSTPPELLELYEVIKAQEAGL